MTFTDYTILTLARHASLPVAGASGASWAWPGNACTASLIKVYPQLQTRSIAFARWVCAWDPVSATNPTYVRLVNCTDGPANLNQRAVFSRVRGPFNVYDDAVDITTAMQSLWNYFKGLNEDFMLGHQTCGNGTDAPLIYASWIEIGFA